MPQGRPRPKIPLWVRFRAWLRRLESPLQIRRSLWRLKEHHTHPLFALLRMSIPYPSWFFPIPGPFSPRALIDDKKNKTGLIRTQFGDLHNLRDIPLWRMRDTPLRSIHRLYELHLADRYKLMGYETEYFFYRPGWKLQDIPDPNDSDLVRYAVVACILEELHKAVNWRLSLGMRRNGDHVYREFDEDPLPPFVPEELPDWTKHVPLIDKELLRQSVPSDKLDAEGNLVLEEEGKSPIFAQRNVITNTG